MPKPTPEEKLFAVIQGAKAPPLRGGRRGQTLARAVAAIDLPQINQALTALTVLLGLATLHPLIQRPRVDRLLDSVPASPGFRIAGPLDGLRSLDAYLPPILEQDPFRVGSVTPAQPAASDTPEALFEPDPAEQLSGLRLVGLSPGPEPTAMIEQDGQTYFLRPGDAVGAFTVKQILPDRVILRAGSRDLELF
jgi:hypothetical protein